MEGWSDGLMMSWRSSITAVIGILIVSTVACADVVSMSNVYTQGRFFSPVHFQSQNQRQAQLFSPNDDLCFLALNIGHTPLSLETTTESGLSAEAPYSIELADEPGSRGLCLYALMGLGLFSAPNWIKRLAFVHFPEWYYDGSHFQIGCDFAATSESLYRLPACYLLPPDITARNSLLKYRQQGATLSFLPTSQFTPETAASRGPPLF
jgi:hypothetical protein